MIDFSRFRLYDALRLEPPTSTAAEAARGPQVMALLQGKSVDLPLIAPVGDSEQVDIAGGG
jgi:hypothetical protein